MGVPTDRLREQGGCREDKSTARGEKIKSNCSFCQHLQFLSLVFIRHIASIKKSLRSLSLASQASFSHHARSRLRHFVTPESEEPILRSAKPTYHIREANISQFRINYFTRKAELFSYLCTDFFLYSEGENPVAFLNDLEKLCIEE